MMISCLTTAISCSFFLFSKKKKNNLCWKKWVVTSGLILTKASSDCCIVSIAVSYLARDCGRKVSEEVSRIVDPSALINNEGFQQFFNYAGLCVSRILYCFQSPNERAAPWTIKNFLKNLWEKKTQFKKISRSPLSLSRTISSEHTRMHAHMNERGAKKRERERES